MWQIFEAEGFTWEEFFAIMKDGRSAKLELAVEDGTLTQEQADFMNSRGQARGYGRGHGGCVGNGYGDQDGFHRGSHGMWNAP